MWSEFRSADVHPRQKQLHLGSRKLFQQGFCNPDLNATSHCIGVLWNIFLAAIRNAGADTCLSRSELQQVNVIEEGGASVCREVTGNNEPWERKRNNYYSVCMDSELETWETVFERKHILIGFQMPLLWWQALDSDLGCGSLKLMKEVLTGVGRQGQGQKGQDMSSLWV